LKTEPKPTFRYSDNIRLYTNSTYVCIFSSNLKMGNKSSAYVSSDGSSGNSDAAAALPGGSFQTIELAITCQKLHDSNVVSKMDPFVVVWLMRGSQWVEVTRTQIVDNCAHPVFDSVVARFNTEEVQSLRFIVYDAENGSGVDLRGKKIVGSVTTTVRDVMGCEAWHGELSSEKSSGSRGHIIVSAEKMLDNPIEISLQMRLEKVEQHEVFSTVAPFIRVSRYGTLGGPLMKVFSTERQKGKNVKFDAVTVSFQHLSNCDLNRNLKFEVFDHETSGKHNLLAETSMTLGQLQQRVSDGKGALGVPFNNCRKPGKPCETTMHFDYFQAKRVPTLYDYLKGVSLLSFFPL
jgi:copine 4/6/7